MLAFWMSQGYPEASAQAMVAAHGRAARGLAQAQRGRQGRFGFMFPELPAASFPEDLLLELANSPPPLGMRDPAPGNGAFDNRQIPAGFTFLSQFVDHDLTLDKTPLDQQEADPGATTNFRQAQLNLDSVYDGAPRAGNCRWLGPVGGCPERREPEPAADPPGLHAVPQCPGRPGLDL
jgi:hypothetical protein